MHFYNVRLFLNKFYKEKFIIKGEVMFKTIKENFFTQKFTALVTMPLLVFVLAIISLFVSSCDKGIDSVGFDYYMDANDRRVVHFNAKIFT